VRRPPTGSAWCRSGVRCSRASHIQRLADGTRDVFLFFASLAGGAAITAVATDSGAALVFR
jgi:hypothetical protein